MKTNSLSIFVLLLALTAGIVNAQNTVRQPQTLPLSQDFESGVIDQVFIGEWTYTNSNTSGSTQTGGKISNGANHTENGTKSYYLSGSGRTCCLISPELANTENGVHVSLYYKNNGDSSGLQVGYSRGTTTFTDFIFLNDVLEGSSEWQKYETDLPPDIKYVVIAKPKGYYYTYVDDIVLSSLTGCPPPSITGATQTDHTITVSWTGSSEPYVLRHAPFYIHDFAEGLGYWTTSPASNSWTWNPDSDYSHSAEGSAISDVNESQHDNYLVSPLIPFGGSITFYVRGIEIAGTGLKKSQRTATPQYGFKLLVSTEENPNDYQPVGETMTATESWQKITVDLSGHTGAGHVAICHICNSRDRGFDPPTPNAYKLAVDDITVYYPWNNTDPIAATSYTIAGLDSDTYYAIQVENNCGKLSNVVNVQTVPEDWSGPYEFINNGDWNMASNWKYELMPPENGAVIIKAAARIPAGYVAKVGEITIPMVNENTPAGSITISDGGQLKHSNSVVATMEKYIDGYTGEKDHYKLLAFPADQSFDLAYINYLKDFFEYDGYGNPLSDLYIFDQNEDLEWINYQPEPVGTNQPENPHPFTQIQNGKGYLCAKKTSKTIKYQSNQGLGANHKGLKPTSNEVTVSLAYTAGKGFAGWNLIGNPYACNAYFTDNRPFYRMVETAEGSEIVLASPENGGNVIAPMEGIFVQATGTDQQAVFTSTEPQNNCNGLMDFTLRKANTRTNARIDRTRIMFGEGSNMSHLDLMSDPNRLYFPIDDKAMAVVYSQPVGELPLNLEVATDGTFVLGFECRIEDLAYCHLIDNLTGTDIDLLQQPEYTFEGRKTDYASRFRLVFATGSSVDGDSFAFINSMGNLSIFGIEGNATVQVIDMLGRVLSSEQFSGSYEKKLNVAPGVYVLRLINGNDVKVQKMIVK